MPTYNESMSGGGLGGGTWSTSYEYIGDGGVAVEGDSDLSALYVYEQQIHWNDDFLVGASFFWGVGTQPKKWYRVVGKCKFPTSAPFKSDDPNCVGTLGQTTFIQTIVASNLSEVCEFLKESNWKWLVESISVFSRPADNRFVDPENDTNELTEVEFAHIPECIDLALEIDGLVTMGLDATASVLDYDFFQYTGDGGVVVGGYAFTETTGTTGDIQGDAGGGGIGGGSAEVELVIDTGYGSHIGSAVSIENLEVVFSTEGNSGEPLSADENTVLTRCEGCSELPTILALTHNLDEVAGVFGAFLKRSSLSIPTSMSLHYSRRLGAWQEQLHYSGLTESGASGEVWRFLFDWSCVDSVGSEELSSYVWKFGLSIVRKNIQTGTDFDTRLLLVVQPSIVCIDALTIGLDFSFTFDTQRQTLRTTQTVVPDLVVLYDNIGLFKSQTWINKPQLKIRIARAITDSGFITQDISPIFPKPPVVQVRNIESDPDNIEPIFPEAPLFQG